MKREIEFRAKDNETKEWVYGYIMNDKQDVIGFYNNCFEFKFRPCLQETVGQYVGIKDKNGKKVYEGDVVIYQDYDKLRFRGVVEYLEEIAMFVARFDICWYSFVNMDLGKIEVIGNIFDKESDNGD